MFRQINLGVFAMRQWKDTHHTGGGGSGGITPSSLGCAKCDVATQRSPLGLPRVDFARVSDNPDGGRYSSGEERRKVGKRGDATKCDISSFWQAPCQGEIASDARVWHASAPDPPPPFARRPVHEVSVVFNLISFQMWRGGRAERWLPCLACWVKLDCLSPLL